MLIVLSVFVFSSHALPYTFSDYPFNNDGITEARIANDIVEAESLSYPPDSFYYDTYSVITPIYNVMIAFASSMIDISTFSISQVMVAMFSVLTVAAGYLVALRISNSYVGALSAAMVLSLLGTFVYLSGSAWKESLGVALLVLLTYAYMNRSDKRHLALELCILAVLPVTHHLVAIIAYLMIGYLTCWSVLNAYSNGRLSRTHFVDLAILGAAGLAAYAYYLGNSFQRLSDYGSLDNAMLIVIVFLALFSLTAFALSSRRRTRFTFAPVVGIAVAFFVYLDYSDPVFPYARGFGSNVLFLGVLYSVVIAFAWFGFEKIVKSSSRFRAIPLGLLLPVLTLLLFALISGLNLESHKVIYRTFDFVGISLALGVSVAVASIANKRLRTVTVASLAIILVCTFPFAYMTEPLVGIRHDTQQYEVDAIAWVDVHAGSSYTLRCDERLSYDAQALYDFGKDPYLPSILAAYNISAFRIMNVLLEEWMVIGVNDYPRGHPVLDAEYVDLVLMYSDVRYVGGPEANQLFLFQTSPAKYISIFESL